MALSCKAQLGARAGLGARARGFAPAARVGRRQLRVCAAAQGQSEAVEVGKLAALSAVAASWAMAGNASAATELAQIAASDNRVAILGTLFVPALGWVAFNMLQPTLNQFDAMAEKADNANPSASAPKGSKKRAVAAGARAASRRAMLPRPPAPRCIGSGMPLLARALVAVAAAGRNRRRCRPGGSFPRHI